MNYLKPISLLVSLFTCLNIFLPLQTFAKYPTDSSFARSSDTIDPKGTHRKKIIS